MGAHDVERELDAERLRVFTRKLLTELRAIQAMLDGGAIESGVRRIGAEQELFLVGPRWAASCNNLDILADLADDAHFTTELGRFNIEFNLDPMSWGGNCLSQMESQLDTLLGRVREAAARHGAEVVMTGILPTLEKADLTLAQMTPKPRYFALNEAMTRLRGGAYIFHLKGQDELKLTHDSVMLEAANTSFQVHFQTGPEEFALLYNIAQAVAAPVLAAATNSPLLFGKRLWRETRIALFQQSVDTRATGATSHLREQSPRVRFGGGWLDDSVLEIFQEDVSRFRVLLAADVEEDPFQVLQAGGVPSLQALRLFNGTIYRWNRPCYGIMNGKPHLRIENRVLPAGPSIVDEVANAAFWLGLMSGMVDQHRDVRKVLTFDQVEENFVAAARLGLGAHLWWIGKKDVPARELLLQELIPLARHGLQQGNLDAADIDRYLGVLTARVETGRTGSQWLLDSYASTREAGTRAERLAALVAASVHRQKEKQPVHTWPAATIEEAGGWQSHYLQVGQFMTTDLFTVNQDELVDLAASMMDWRKIRHVPVEDAQHKLVGLVTHRTILRLLARNPEAFSEHRSVPVSQIMERDLIIATPTMSTLEAINLMRLHKVGCLPVVEGDRLVGIVTERDFMNVAGQLLEASLHGRPPVEHALHGSDTAEE